MTTAYLVDHERDIDWQFLARRSAQSSRAVAAPMGGTNMACDGPREPGMVSLPPRFRLAEAGHGLR